MYAFHEPDSVCEIHGNNCPFYIGMGSPMRPQIHFRKSVIKRNTHFYSKLRSLLTKRIQPEIRIIIADLTKYDAFDIEIKLIALYGRQDIKTGCLTNHTDGGDGGFGNCSNLGRELSLEHRLNLSKIKYSSAQKLVMSEAKRHKMIPVECFNLEGKTIQQFQSQQAVKLSGFEPSKVSQVLKGRRKFHGGYGWRYA